jgi:hypothetical protein
MNNTSYKGELTFSAIIDILSLISSHHGDRVTAILLVKAIPSDGHADAEGGGKAVIFVASELDQWRH